MEYVEGELLSARVAKGSLPIREVIDIGLQVAEALDEAHGRGIVHRDIKSANLMRTERGLVKVLDFGLAKFLGPGARRAEAVTQPQVTMAGMVVGTVSYMAPEQALGHAVDHRSDLFSLGIVLYELATGRMPFAGTSLDRDHRPHPPRDTIAAVALRYGDSRVVRRGRRACAREVADVPLSVRASVASRSQGRCARTRRERRRAPAQHAIFRGSRRSGATGRELGRGHDFRRTSRASPPTTGLGPASPRPSAPI